VGKLFLGIGGSESGRKEKDGRKEEIPEGHNPPAIRRCLGQAQP
jgi:hypothetical protein